MARRKSSEVALVLGLVFGFALVGWYVLAGIWKYILTPIFHQGSTSVSSGSALDRFTGEVLFFKKSPWRVRFYVAINVFCLSFPVFVFSLRSQKDHMIFQACFIALTLAFITLGGMIVFELLIPQRVLLSLGFPFGKFVKAIDDHLGNHFASKAKIKFSVLVAPFIPEIQKFAAAHCKTMGRLPRPLREATNWDDENLKTFLLILQRSGAVMPADVVVELLNFESIKTSNEGFKLFFFEGHLELQESVAPAKWAARFVDIFAADDRYLENLGLVCNQIDKSETQEVMVAIRYERQKREEEARILRLRQQMESGHLAAMASIGDVDRLGGHEFEKFLEGLFKAMGYKVTPTKQVGDQGADLLLEKLGENWVLQAKRYSESVGNSAIQEVVAAKSFYRCARAIVVTNQEFTKAAKELAESNNVELCGRNRLIQLLKEYPQESPFGRVA